MHRTTLCRLSVPTALLLSLLATGCGSSQPFQKGQDTPRSFGAGTFQSVADKSGDAKAALGHFVGRREIFSSLTPELPVLNDGSSYELHPLTLAKGQRLTASMRSTYVDSFLLIGRQNGEDVEILARDDDSGRGLSARIEMVVPETGDYLVVATSAGAGEYGRYALDVEASEGAREEDDRAPVVEGTTAVSGIGQRVTNRLADGDPRLPDNSPFHTIDFEATEGTRLEVNLESSAFDAFLALGTRDADGEFQLIAQNDDVMSGSTSNSRLSVTLLESRSYTVLVTTYNPLGRGSYTLSIDEAGDPAVDFAQIYPGGGDPNGRYAVLVGINDYPGNDNDLVTCTEDVGLMKQLLVGSWGFEEENVVTILDEAATRDRIAGAVANHLAQAGKDGVAVFYFSGHGLQLGFNALISGDRDPEADGSDEALAMWDADGRSGAVIIDDELGAMLSDLPTDNLLAILDTCHSGTGSRGGPVDLDALDKRLVLVDGAAATYPAPTEALVDLAGTNASAVDNPTRPLNHVLLAAAAPDQTALSPRHTWRDIESRASLFTYFLIKEIKKAGADTTFDIVLEAVRDRIRGYGAEQGIGAGDIQRPQAEGDRQDESISSFLKLR